MWLWQLLLVKSYVCVNIADFPIQAQIQTKVYIVILILLLKLRRQGLLLWLHCCLFVLLIISCCLAPAHTRTKNRFILNRTLLDSVRGDYISVNIHSIHACKLIIFWGWYAFILHRALIFCMWCWIQPLFGSGKKGKGLLSSTNYTGDYGTYTESIFVFWGLSEGGRQSGWC